MFVRIPPAPLPPRSCNTSQKRCLWSTRLPPGEGGIHLQVDRQGRLGGHEIKWRASKLGLRSVFMKESVRRKPPFPLFAADQKIPHKIKETYYADAIESNRLQEPR